MAATPGARRRTAIITFGPKPLWAFDMTRFVDDAAIMVFHIDFADKDALVRRPRQRASGHGWTGSTTNNWSNNIERPGSWCDEHAGQRLFIMGKPLLLAGGRRAAAALHRSSPTGCSSRRTCSTWIISGDIDFQTRRLDLEHTCSENEAGDYRVFLGASASHCCMQCNLTPERRLRGSSPREVRRALMAAVNRAEMNELV